MSLYADSSFLVSCYLNDANTAQAKRYLLQANAGLLFNALHILEVGNAFRLGIFRRLLTTNDPTMAWANLEQDVRSGRLIRTTVKWPVTLRVASFISKRHSATVGTRSLDLLHVAAAKSLRAGEFISFDTRQRDLASLVGLTVRP